MEKKPFTAVSAPRGDTLKIPLLVTIPTGTIVRIHLRQTAESQDFYNLSIEGGKIIIPAEIASACGGAWVLDVELTYADTTVETVQRANVYFFSDVTRAYSADYSLMSDFERRVIIARELKFRREDGTLEEIPSVEEIESIIEMESVN
jgi:hypothetical protein